MSDLTPREPVAPMSVREFARKTGLCTATAHRVLAGEELSLSNARAAHPFLKKCPCCGQAALDAVRAEERERCKPKVKPLEWEDHPLNGEPVLSRAITKIGTYFICDDVDDFSGAYLTLVTHDNARWWQHVRAITEHLIENHHDDNIAPLKIAAQADYERRILSALEAGHE